MLLLHISDIHFRHPQCSTLLDADKPYRTLLLQDVRERVAELGAIDAIFLTGDIAYSGITEEYDAAFGWLKQLVTVGKCSLERVFVVPGNHDVHQNTITSNRTVQNAQLAIIHSSANKRERELFSQLQDVGAGRALFSPVDAYNTFAAQFNCQIYRERPFWVQDLPLRDGITLRVHGLTSTFLSGAGLFEKKEDSRGSLYLSPLQTVLDPADRTVNVVLCHHPPDWFMDHDVVDDAICGRASIHFFGHKHRQRITRDPAYIRLAAGAVNPDRYEQGWEPGYNLISLSVQDKGGRFELDIEAHLRAWQTSPDMFRTKMNGQDSVFRHQLAIRGGSIISENSKITSPKAETLDKEVGHSNVGVVNVDGIEVVPTMSDTKTPRNLVLRFWNLASSQRREIARRLGLIDDSELQLPEPERYGKALLRARERELLDRLAEEVERMETH